jgi:hypothetical protein
MPYIPTTTAAVTRGAQNITLSGSAFAAVNNPVEGTLLARVSMEDSVANSGIIFQSQYSASVGAANRLFVGASSGIPLFYVQVSGIVQTYLSTGVSVSASPTTVAGSYATNVAQAASNGTLSVVDSVVNIPVVDRICIPSDGNGNLDNCWKGLIQRTELYPRAMTSAELAAITTPGVLQ